MFPHGLWASLVTRLRGVTSWTTSRDWDSSRPQAETGMQTEYIWSGKSELTRRPDWWSCSPPRDRDLVLHLLAGEGSPCAEWSCRWDTLYKGSMLKSLINILCLPLSEIFWRSVGFPVFLNPGGLQICWWCKSVRETARIKVWNAIKWNWFQ